MKIWQETRQVLDRLETLTGEGRQAAIAVLVRIEGSSYRRPGAKFLVADDGATLGSISGGCLEEDVRQAALQVIHNGLPRRLRYETGSDEESVWGLGLGCNGTVELFVEAADAGYRETAARIRRLLAGDRAFAVATLLDGAAGRRLVVTADGPFDTDPTTEAGLAGTGAMADASLADSDATTYASLVDAALAALDAGSSTVARVGDADAFIEVQQPPPWLLVCGAGDDALPLVRFADAVGWRVVLADHRRAYLTAARFPGACKLLQGRPGDELAELPPPERTYAVVKTHNLENDTAWARRLLAAGLPYVGLLGPRDRRDEILAAIDDDDRHRVYGPVGLDVGAEGPEQVAMSVVAELLAVVAERQPVHLRDSREAIHAGD